MVVCQISFVFTRIWGNESQFDHCVIFVKWIETHQPALQEQFSRKVHGLNSASVFRVCCLC